MISMPTADIPQTTAGTTGCSIVLPEKDKQNNLNHYGNVYITKTCLYNFDPLKPHFYIVKLGFTGELAEAVLTSTHNLCFEQKYEKYQNFLSENFPCLVVKFSIYLNSRIFVMVK